ncbi:MAG: hypothetical protein KJ698_00070, partial [Actinobacteria bacterium]|nr:hypothetical protein [Actinomycetota bacterium]
WCKPRYVKYDTGTHPSAFNTYQERRHFACHELGHTLGLFHRNSGYCLDVSGVSYTLSPHNQNHLSDLYG